MSTSPASGWSVDGSVFATLIVGNTVYIGGNFANALAPDGSTVARKNLAAFDMTTGALVTSFKVDAGSSVRSIVTDGTSLYVGGAFAKLGSTSQLYVGKIKIATATVDTTFKPVLDGNVRALLYSGGSLYVGGVFTHVNTTARNRLAKVDPATGALDTTFVAPASGGVYALKMNPTQPELFVGGDFTTLSSTARTGLGAVNPTTGAIMGPVFANSAKPTFGLAVNEDGSALFGSGGSATNATAAWNTTSGVRKWRIVTDGDNQALTYYRGEVYFGFHDGYQGDGSIKLLAADATSGAVDPDFRPKFDEFWGVWSLDISDKGLVAGGDFTSVGGVATHGFARFLATSAPPPVPPTSVTLLGTNTQWGYWDQGTRPTNWETSGFDSSTWPTGVARLGYGDTFDTTLVGFGPSSTSKYITTYFRASFSLAQIPDALNLEISDDDGAVVYINGTEVGRDDMPTGAVTNATLATTDRSGGAETALATLPVSPSVLSAGVNTVAVEVHQKAKSSSDMGLDFELDGLYDSAQTTPNQPPTASFTSSVSQLSGTFDGSGSTDTDGNITAYSWDFGDGTTSSGPTQTHTYATAGDYSVSLSVLDDQGSLTTVTHVVTAVSPNTDVVPALSNWRWRYAATAPPTGWNTTGFDASSWSLGNAVLGFGNATQGTNIDTFATTSARPQTAYFTKQFTLADASKVTKLVLTTVADDGVVVYVNGTEVGRSNMPTGTITNTSYASSSKRTSVANAAPVVITVPTTLLVSGTNVVSAETHLNSRSTADLSFDLKASASTAGSAPTASFTQSVNQLVGSFDASASSDVDGSIASYSWNFGDGATGTGVAPTHTYAAGGSYPVTLTVTDNDDLTGSSQQTVSPSAPAGDSVIIANGSSWRWKYDTTAPPSGWKALGFDASSWNSGNGVFGFGDPSVLTNIDTFATTSARPQTAYFTKQVTLADASKVTKLVLNTVADDGIVVYVNGTEVARSNMPTGAIASTTYASSARRTSVANAAPLVITVPTSLLVTGTNVISAETHVNYRGTPDLTFDLKAILTTS